MKIAMACSAFAFLVLGVESSTAQIVEVRPLAPTFGSAGAVAGGAVTPLTSPSLGSATLPNAPTAVLPPPPAAAAAAPSIHCHYPDKLVCNSNNQCWTQKSDTPVCTAH